MAFNLRVTFTGVCALVRNADESKRCQMCVVLPDGRGTSLFKEGLSADGQSLKRHRGFLQFKVRQLAALSASTTHPLPDGADAIWYLERHRLTFYTLPADTKRQPFPFVDTGINRIAKLDLIVPKHSQIDPRALAEQPPDGILAQVLLHEGVLSHNPRTIRWVFPPTLHGRVLNPNLSHEANLEIPGLEQFDVVATPFDGGEPVRWSFIGRDNEEVAITIANLCDDNPLRWETVDSTRVVDNDFRWYYRLLTNEAQADLRNEMRGFPFPVPQPVPESLEEPNGQAINCIPAQMARAAFNLDRFLPAAFAAQSSAEARRSR